jgi:predicted small integral membrane protein
MDLHTSLWLFQAIQAVGLALWLSIAVLNNLQAFSSSVGAIGATLAMAPLRQPPAIEFPLLRRACQSPTLARVALLVILLLQIVASLSAWIGSYALVIAQDPLMARAWLNLALGAMLAFTFAMLLGGLWFGYWIRQEGLQLTHLVLVLWSILAFFLFNLNWA